MTSTGETQPAAQLPKPLPEPPKAPTAANDTGGGSTLPAAPGSSPRRRALLALGLIALALGGWWGSGYVFAYTDDAYLTSDLVSITPEISGPVAAVHVTDNQWVKRGAELFTIDPEPFRIELDQAQAREAVAKAQLPIDQAEIDNLRAEKQAADAATQLATTNLGRDTPLGHSGYISAQTLDKSRAIQEESVARQKAAAAALERATQTIRLHEVAVQSAHAASEFAEWRLSRTHIKAPVDGYITHLTLQPGDMAATNRAAVAIVDSNAWRIVANYKEYYLRHFTIGGEAWVWLDTHPWRFYRARIQGIARGISREPGNESLVPYVSPTVDWIRLQRRIPVRLELQQTPGEGQLFMGTDARVLVIY